MKPAVIPTPREPEPAAEPACQWSEPDYGKVVTAYMVILMHWLLVWWWRIRPLFHLFVVVCIEDHLHDPEMLLPEDEEEDEEPFMRKDVPRSYTELDRNVVSFL